MQRISPRFAVLIGLAVVLASIAVWRLLLSGGDEPADKSDPNAARIARLRQQRNVAALGRELTNPNPDVARRAIAALGEIGSESLDHVRGALADARPRVREKAAATYAHVAQHKDAAPLARLATTDESPNVRAAAVSGLDRMMAFEQMDAILAAMDDPDVLVRRRAANAAERFACVRVGYNADASPAQRQAAIERLRAEWLKSQQRAAKYWEMIRTKPPTGAGAGG